MEPCGYGGGMEYRGGTGQFNSDRLYDPPRWLTRRLPFVGGFLAQQLGFGEPEGFDGRSLLVAIGGSVVLLAGYRMLSRG